ncbi:MAG: co-chaperone GroES [Candidatus Bathyarchaeota archaeon]
MPIRPLRNQIVVRPEKVTEINGIAIVEHGRMHVGTVIAAGPGKRDKHGRLQPCLVKPGDRIHFGEFAFQEADQDGERVLIMTDMDVAGVEEAA